MEFMSKVALPSSMIPTSPASVGVSWSESLICATKFVLAILLLAPQHPWAYQILRQRGNGRGISKRDFKRLEDHEDVPSIERRPTLDESSIRKKSDISVTITNIHQLRSEILDHKKSLHQVEIGNYVKETTASLFNHDVLQLMSRRYQENSIPGARKQDDQAKLALAIEGGGMRGAVSAGMAAAVVALGLTDTIDVIYGSSAGSIIGAYMVSRQMCMDVYVDILPAAKKTFVCKGRILRSIIADMFHVVISAIRKSKLSRFLMPPFSNKTILPSGKSSLSPGLNISFVLDGIMSQECGIRPMDEERFFQNDKKQPLRVVASCIDNEENMFSTSFGTADFFNATAAKRIDGKRHGLFACLEASVTIPGATGPPVQLETTTGGNKQPISCFDAFCFEPLPYRSAVNEGATHVLVLCSRPEGYQPATKPGAYEKTIAPWYFRSHGHDKAADFFEQGGQQYIYAEDLLLLEHAKSSSRVLVPPPQVLYEGDNSTKRSETRHQEAIANRHQDWNSAHLLPLKVPSTTPELANLEQDEDIVLEAVRSGFAAAFDALVPVVGQEEAQQIGVNGHEAARLLFPDRSAQEARKALHTRLCVPGDLILPHENNDNYDVTLKQTAGSFSRVSSSALPGKRKKVSNIANKKIRISRTSTIMRRLPGFKDGKYPHLAKDLQPKQASSSCCA